MRYVIYARKSTEEDDRQVLSIQAQFEEMRAFVAKEKLDIVSGAASPRHSHSGGDLPRRRPRRGWFALIQVSCTQASRVSGKRRTYARRVRDLKGACMFRACRGASSRG